MSLSVRWVQVGVVVVVSLSVRWAQVGVVVVVALFFYTCDINRGTFCCVPGYTVT